jgi:flavin-dependent dehydrogenase
VDRLERAGSGWIINDEIIAPLVVGAGGHFCPIARRFRAKDRDDLIVAQEVEFVMSPEQQTECRVQKHIPELYFCQDLRGYGWCVRKGDHLNIGLGRIDKRQLHTHVQAFLKFIRRCDRIGFDVSDRLNGHTYFAYAPKAHNIFPDGILLIGDAFGTAIAASGEGIGPAILSGIAAARTTIEADGDYRSASLGTFSKSMDDWLSAGPSIADLLPRTLRQRLAATFLQQKWFCRGVVIDRWFLQRRNKWACNGQYALVI